MEVIQVGRYNFNDGSFYCVMILQHENGTPFTIQITDRQFRLILRNGAGQFIRMKVEEAGSVKSAEIYTLRGESVIEQGE